MSHSHALFLYRFEDGTPFSTSEQERNQLAKTLPNEAKNAPETQLPLLVDHIESCGHRAVACPSQTTTSFVDVNTGLFHIVRVVCKTWSCPYCGRVKRAKLAADIQAAKPNRFITLTTAGHTTQTPRQVFDATRRQLSELAKKVRKDHGKFEYLRCLETTKTGFPHYHLIVRSPYLDQHELSRHWCQLTSAYIVDIRKLSKDEKAIRYVMKYLGKQEAVPFTNRRISWTRGFFPKQPPKPPSQMCAADVEHWSGSLEDVSGREFPSAIWDKVNKWHWIQTAAAPIAASPMRLNHYPAAPTIDHDPNGLCNSLGDF